ncbi:MAG TPA: hypothetical protein VFR81_18350 [Longimicrobium sp.]|nr:hypothetical protein [Longimicrobium sp.]
MKRILFALALSLSAAGCNDSTLPAPQPTLFFAAAPQQGQPPATPEINVTVVREGFQVIGVLATPDACRKLTGEFTPYAPADQVRLVLVVRVEPAAGVGCSTAVGRFVYNARVQPLAAGRYPVQVFHQLAQTGNPDPVMVYEGEIEIP